MRSVLIGPVYPYRGGISHHTTLLARALDSAGECRVISFKRQYPKRIYPGRTDIDPSERILEVDAEYLLDPLNPLSWMKCANEIIRWKPDHIIFQWWVTIWGPLVSTVAILCRRAGIPITFIVHNVYPHEKKPWDKLISWLTLRLGSYFIIHSERERQRMLQLLPDSQLRLVPHPTYTMFSGDRISTVEAKRFLGLDVQKTTLLFFGMVREYKGLMYVIKALSLLKDAGYPAQLVIAGEFWQDRAKYDHVIMKLGLEDDILIDDRYIPNEEVAIYFSAADFLTAPYTGGTQSGVAAIATAFGIPIITTEHITSGISGSSADEIITVPASSSKEIADAVRHHTSTARQQRLPPAEDDSWQVLVRTILGNSGEVSQA